MRWLITLSLFAMTACPAIAQENDAEKLFRAMEQKVRAAKTLQVRFDLSITDAQGKKGNIKGSLILGEGDKYRAQAEGKLFSEALKFTEVSNGTTTKAIGDTKPPPEDKKEKSPKGSGAYFRGTLPCEGFFLSSLNMDRRDNRVPDPTELSGFKLVGKEKIGERNTQVIQYTVKEKGKEALSMKLWLDAQTNLPVKLAATGGKSDITDVTETYSEFAIDAKVDAKLFELPK